MSWTDERIEQLRNMWEKGLTASQIADELGGVSRNAVIGKAHRLGLKSRPSPVKATEKVAKPAKAPAAPKPAAPVAPRMSAPVAPRPVAAPPRSEHPVVELLRQLEPEELSPLDALKTLMEWKKLWGAQPGSDTAQSENPHKGRGEEGSRG